MHNSLNKIKSQVKNATLSAPSPFSSSVSAVPSGPWPLAKKKLLAILPRCALILTLSLSVKRHCRVFMPCRSKAVRCSMSLPMVDTSLMAISTKLPAANFVDVRDLALNGERRELFATRRTDDMIIFKPAGETKAIINVFTDVDCGYCRKLHNEVPELNAMGIEVRYLAFPRAGISLRILRSKLPPPGVLIHPMKPSRRSRMASAPAPQSVQTTLLLTLSISGQSLGVTGTPAIVLMDGTLIPGYKPAAELC